MTSIESAFLRQDQGALDAAVSLFRIRRPRIGSRSVGGQASRNQTLSVLQSENPFKADVLPFRFPV